MESDPYEWQSVKKNLKDIRFLINQIERTQVSFLQDINNLILPYTPTDLRGEVRACFILGGAAMGFTFDNNPTLNVALHKINGDYEGLKYLVAHELYHSIQTLGIQNFNAGKNLGTIPVPLNNSFQIILNVWAEGTATLVGNTANVKNPKWFSKFTQEEFHKNADRSRQNFALMEALLYQSFNDPDASAEQIYNIGFTTAYDQTLYYAGYEMAKVIEKYRDKKTVAAIIGKKSEYFF